MQFSGSQAVDLPAAFVLKCHADFKEGVDFLLLLFSTLWVCFGVLEEMVLATLVNWSQKWNSSVHR